MSLKEAEAGKQLDVSQDFVVGREDSASKAAGHLKGLELVDDKPGMFWHVSEYWLTYCSTAL